VDKGDIVPLSWRRERPTEDATAILALGLSSPVCSRVISFYTKSRLSARAARVLKFWIAAIFAFRIPWGKTHTATRGFGRGALCNADRVLHGLEPSILGCRDFCVASATENQKKHDRHRRSGVGRYRVLGSAVSDRSTHLQWLANQNGKGKGVREVLAFLRRVLRARVFPYMGGGTDRACVAACFGFKPPRVPIRHECRARVREIRGAHHLGVLHLYVFLFPNPGTLFTAPR
jgi:hypothetical protein